MYRKNAWLNYDENEKAKMEAFSKAYRAYIDAGKTERECVTASVAAAEKQGFKNLDTLIANGTRIAAGDRVYVNWMGKCFLCFVIGSNPMDQGMNILGAHIDSPRIDIKQNPLYEAGNMAYLDTHYYGGIKKYQWVAMPLAIHGVVVKKDGEVKNIVIGEDECDPVLYITDLLPHLGADQMSKTAAKVIEGEMLDILIGSEPLKGDEKEPVKKALMNLITEKYGFEEEDFISAELEVVPAGRSRDMGLDRSFICGYGHDDRVCAYPSMQAVLDFEGTPDYTVCAILCDKEEIGSVGATGMQSMFFENAVADILALMGIISPLSLRRCLKNSRMLSSDVSAGFDPAFASAFEKNNAAMMGYGVCLNKFTGSRGKSGSNDANPEFIAQLRNIMDDASINFQTAELGKVDVGGGGTIAYICALYGMNVIDCGIPVLSMHAPWEVISKADLWEEYKCYCAFIKNAK